MEYDESVVNKHLVDKFNWEIDPSTPTTWRIEDGTAPFNIFTGFTQALQNDFFEVIKLGKVTLPEKST